MTTLLQPQAAYELWADTYAASAHNPLMQSEETVVERVIRAIVASRALDVGTGSGRYLPILATTGATVVGVDLSMPMLRCGAGPRICANACALPFRRATFQLVNASLMVGDVKDLRGWTAEMARVLSLGGHLVYSDFHPVWTEQGWQRTFRDATGELTRGGFRAAYHRRSSGGACCCRIDGTRDSRAASHHQASRAAGSGDFSRGQRRVARPMIWGRVVTLVNVRVPRNAAFHLSDSWQSASRRIAATP